MEKPFSFVYDLSHTNKNILSRKHRYADAYTPLHKIEDFWLLPLIYILRKKKSHKLMYRSGLTLIFFFSLTISCFSQTDFRNGYLVTDKGDTLFGLINYREGIKAFGLCEFKGSKTGKTINYTPNEIVGYGFIKDKIYLSKDIKLEGADPKPVFVEVVLSGIVSLYRLEESFLVGKEGKIYQLINEQVETIVNGTRVVKNSNQFVATLNLLLFDCVELRSDIQKTKLVEGPLIDVIQAYNTCMGEKSIVYKESKPWLKSGIGISGGYGISAIKFDVPKNTSYKHLEGKFETSASLVGGLAVELESPRLSERFSFKGEILYLSSTFYRFNLFEDFSSTERNYVTINLKQLKIPFGLRYTFPARKFTPYASTGFSVTFNLNPESIWVREIESNNVVNTSMNEALNFNNQQLGYWASFGFLRPVSNKLNAFVELRYERTNGISNSTFVPQKGLGSNVINYQIIFGIRTK